MASKKVIPGSLTEAYKKREGDFSPDLVGFQLTKGTPLFTLGNFGVTTNVQPKADKEFNNGVFSNEFTLENLNLTEEESKAFVSNNIYTTLNLDPKDLSKFSYYGSFVEFLRVNLESIIGKWKGSLYITDEEGGYSTSAKNTVLGYSYDSVSNQSTFKIPTLFIQNKFELIYNDLGGLLLDAKDISNIKLSYDSYEISNEYGQFDLLGYTGSTENVDPYITVITKGEAYPTLTGSTFGTFIYHLKPQDSVVDKLFFDTLEDFENILLNRLVLPQYTSTFEAPTETESGTMLLTRKSFTWPTTDGYNIDIDTTEYGEYINQLLQMGTDYDRLRGNLMSRKFVSTSIHEFDTDDGTEEQSQGKRIGKLLKIYGREFDEIKKYTDSIKFVNVVTYDKRDNTPDELIKTLAKTLGFEAIKSVTDNELISYIAKANESVFGGYSRDLSTKEIDTELWRRLVINAWWLYKSKGTRKVIEFFINLFGLNECLVNFDEYVYVVENKIDVEGTFSKIEEILSRGLDETITVDRTLYPVDEVGFPNTLPNTQDYYFQMDGFWYDGGTDKTVGNNPHFGPYDYGSKYFEKFTCFIDDFSGKTEVITQEFVETINLFEDYNKGDIEITFEDGKPMMDYSPSYAKIMVDNDRVSEHTTVSKAGFTTENSRTGRGSFKLTFNCEPNTPPIVIPPSLCPDGSPRDIFGNCPVISPQPCPDGSPRNANGECPEIVVPPSCPNYQVDTETGLVVSTESTPTTIITNDITFNITRSETINVYLDGIGVGSNETAVWGVVLFAETQNFGSLITANFNIGDIVNIETPLFSGPYEVKSVDINGIKFSDVGQKGISLSPGLMDFTPSTIVFPGETIVTPGKTVYLTDECCTHYGYISEQPRLSDTYSNTLGSEGQVIDNLYNQTLTNAYGNSVLDESKVCFWCRKVQPLCDMSAFVLEYYNNFGCNGLVDIALSEGLILNNEIDGTNSLCNVNPNNYLSQITSSLINKYDGYCLITHEDFSEVSETCCSVRGGTWTDINANDTNAIPDFKCVLVKEVVEEPPQPPPT